MAEEKAPTLFGDIIADTKNIAAFLVPGGHGANKSIEHLTSLHSFVEWCADWGISRVVILGGMLLPLTLALLSLLPQTPILTVSWLFMTLPVWGPVGLGLGFVRVWHWYVQSLFIATRKPVLMEMKIPREVYKSPRAMEIVFDSIWTSGGETTFIDRFYDGKMRPFFSFELVSLGGEVHFYFWCWRPMKDVIETALYAQYPEVEIVEAEDYASKFVYDPNEYDMFGNDQILEGDETGVMPIRSYIDYELDKDPKEEFKIDPLAQVIEVLSTLKQGEQAWIQIIISSCKGGSRKKFLELVNKRVTKIRKEASLNPGKEDAPEDDEKKYGAFPRPTWIQNQQVEAIQRHATKKLYFTGIRLCYIAKISAYRGEVRSAIRWIFLPFTNEYMNWIRPKRWHGPFDYPWQDFQGIRWRITSRRFLDAYRRRSFFYPPWVTPHSVMSAESLASIWHPPGSTVRSPGLQRISSTKSEPPPNLPM